MSQATTAPPLASPSPATLVELWDRICKQYNLDAPFLFDGPTTETPVVTRKEINAFAHCLASFFMSRGLAAGDRVLLFDLNGADYLICDLAIQLAGCVNVTVEHRATKAQLAHIVSQVKPKAILVPSYHDYLTYKPWLDSLADDYMVLCGSSNPDLLTESDRVTLISYAMEYGKVWWRENQEAVRQRKAERKAADLASIVYDTRSRGTLPEEGTTLTHGNFMAALIALDERFPELSSTDAVLSLLSNAYLLQRLAAYYLPLVKGMPIHYSKGPSSYFRELQKGKPKVIVLVPEVLYLVRKEAFKRYRKGKLFKRRYYKASFRVAHKVQKLKHSGVPVPFGLAFRYWLARIYILNAVRRKYFRNLRLLVCDRQGLTEELEYFCHALRLPLVTGFGVHASTGIVAVNKDVAHHPRAAGLPISSIEVRSGKDPLLQVRGPVVSPGAWTQPARSKSDWLTTDIPGRVQDGWVYLED
ncbi:MAG: AMP-binding protein [Bacteroidetes bacterium]|nr:AMP-binding protein [Bacteroidota bacterium]